MFGKGSRISDIRGFDYSTNRIKAISLPNPKPLAIIFIRLNQFNQLLTSVAVTGFKGM